MGPIEEPFGYSKQQRPAGTLPPPRIRFPGNHLLLLEAIARHNGQVIHPLRLLARETATARGNHSSSQPSPPPPPPPPPPGGGKQTHAYKQPYAAGYTPTLHTGNTGTACRPRVTLRRERLFPVPLRKSSSTTAVARLLTIVPLRPRGSRSLPTAIDSTAPPLFLGLSLGSPLGFDSSLVFLVEEENQDSNFY